MFRLLNKGSGVNAARNRDVIILMVPIYKISYDLLYKCLKFIVRATYDSDLKRANFFLRNIVS